MKSKKKIIFWITSVVGVIIYIKLLKRKELVKHEKIKYDKEKYESYYKKTLKLLMKEPRISVEDYLIKKGYSKISIYGAKELGQYLYSCLKGTKVNVECFIDNNASYIDKQEIEVIYPEENIPKVDAIIVTPYVYFDSIKSNLMKFVDCPIISFSEIVDEIWK